MPDSYYQESIGMLVQECGAQIGGGASERVPGTQNEAIEYLRFPNDGFQFSLFDGL